MRRTDDKSRRVSKGRSKGSRERSGKRLGPKFIVASLLGLALAGAVLQQGFEARQWESPRANSAQRLWTALQDTPGEANRKAVERDARNIVRARPVNVQAISLLGVIESQRSNERKTDALMNAAYGLNRRDSAANVWLFSRNIAQRRYGSAFRSVDILLRRQPTLAANFFPTLLQSLNDPAAIKPLAERLAENPNWREGFLLAAVKPEHDANTHQILLSEIKAAGGEIQPLDLSMFLARLTAEKQYEQAYLNWLLFIPIKDLSTLRTVYDGDFDGWPQVYPFTWALGRGVRGSIEKATPFDRNENALRLDYDGVSTVQFPRQLVMLTPGAYRLSGEYLTASDESAGRINLGLSCEPGGEPLAVFPAGNTRGQWKKFSVDFRTSDLCKAQWLEFTPNAGERKARVEVWYDGLAIDAVGAGI